MINEVECYVKKKDTLTFNNDQTEVVGEVASFFFNQVIIFIYHKAKKWPYTRGIPTSKDLQIEMLNGFAVI